MAAQGHPPRAPGEPGSPDVLREEAIEAIPSRLWQHIGSAPHGVDHRRCPKEHRTRKEGPTDRPRGRPPGGPPRSRAPHGWQHQVTGVRQAWASEARSTCNPHLRMVGQVGQRHGARLARRSQLQRCAAATEGNLGGEQAQGGQAIEHLQQCTMVRTSPRSKASRDSLLSIRLRTRIWKRMRRRDRGSAGGEVRGGNERSDALRLRGGGVLRGVRTRCGEPAVRCVRQRTTPAMAAFVGPAPREQQAKRIEPHDWQRDATSPRLIRWRKPARP